MSGRQLELARDAQVVVPSALCDYLIDRMDYHVVMNFCICRRSNDCADYPRDYGCLFMGDAARGINPEWGRPVSRDEAKAHLRKCEETGLIHFLGKAKLDALWLGVGPGDEVVVDGAFLLKAEVEKAAGGGDEHGH